MRIGSSIVASLLAGGLMLPPPAAAETTTAAHVRFLDGIPGTQQELLVTSGGLRVSAGGPAAPGELTPYANVAPGLATLGADGMRVVRRLAAGGRYTVVAYRTAGHEHMRVYVGGRASAGSARLRVVHVAPELGSPDVKLGGRVIAQHVRFGQDSGYLDVAPGHYRLAVAAPGRSGSLASTALTLTAGTSTTAFVTGTGGLPTSIVVAPDSTLTPAGAPETGLGGLAGGGPQWLAVALIALAGGALAVGAAGRVRRTRPR